MDEAYDVVIVGGAVMGASVAYHLAADPAFSGRVLVLEQDPSYRFCASALSAGSIRQQYSSAINVAISRAGIAFLRDIGTLLEVEGERPEIGLTEGGYLFLASPAQVPAMRRSNALQRGLGADIALLTPDALAARFPWLDTDGIALGSLGLSGEGWFDGFSLMQAFRRKARALGVRFVQAQAVGFARDGERIAAVHTAAGARIGCGAVVIAAGTGAPALARAVGIDLPVHCRKRMVFTFTCADPVPDCPLLIEPSGVYVRPEGRGFLCGFSPPPEADPDCTDFEIDPTLFEDRIWPVLAARIPAFERIRPGRAWAGHYDLNIFDANAILGPAPQAPNLLLCSGFSGHGLQQAPAVGRGLAELLVHGRYRTLDLSPLGYTRLAQARPLTETQVV
ncbi:NAD(P)/FAD-dependent oxidoreductase [Aquabacter spiritensis]|uniref:Glycine/D-amino acid oxidase-like deaminating enzyme n=1 Tax=Aquabacter spiritensis TaxID=933073 RepID=A0A4R3M9K6_9HYPH|nr:FAD-binding oxidoreductase [Aquabacter spiritensis]TCT08065.1 glycine/D-amino acid oxidase-like deaminating enzyme [Aquabacter spiritensis]